MAQLLEMQTRPAGVPGPGRWVVDPARTRVTCSGRASRIAPTVRAWFRATTGAVDIAADDGKSSLEVIIDIASVTTGRAVWDLAIQTADPLSAAAYPTATYRSCSITWTEPGHAEIDGELELAGATQPVSLAVRYRYQNQDAVELAATGSIVSRDRLNVPGLTYLVPRQFALDIETVAVPA